MHKLQLACIVTMAGLSTFLQSAVGTEGHFDNLKNKVLTAECGVRFDNMEKTFREKRKKAAEDVENSTIIQDFEQGAIELATCITGLTNVTAIEEKIKKARDFDTVFNKHCKDRISGSLDSNEKVQPCSSAAQHEQNAVTMRGAVQ